MTLSNTPLGHTAPGAILPPRLAFAGCVACALTLAQRPCREARALGFAPPTGARQGKAPQDRFIFIEHHALAPASPIRQGGEVEGGIGEVRWGGIEPPRGPAGADVLFF
jgi:hypothetical protein